VNALWAKLREGYWAIPAACVVVGGALAISLVHLDHGLDREGLTVAFTGGPESARSLLSTIATAMFSLTALVFSITIVVLQLASSQFSPRALRTFLRDRQNQLALGVFLGTFVYALVALRAVRGRDGLVDRFIPGITVTVAFLLVLVAVALFVQYIHHIAQSIRVVTIIDKIAGETRSAIDRVHPDSGPLEPDPPPSVVGARQVAAEGPGTVAAADVDRLVRIAAEEGGMVELVPCVGDFVATGMPLFDVVGVDGRDGDLRAAVDLAVERDVRQDVAFGLRQLVDIAERALSPGVNDPSTAVQCLDQVHDLLRRLVARPYPSSTYHDDAGEPRAVVTSPAWSDHVALALDEIRHWGSRSPQVRQRMQAMVDDLIEIAAPERRGPLLARLPLWNEPL
jgi:uncharacterized membrane protein